MKQIELGTIKATAVVFQSPFNPKHFYVVRAEKMDYLEFMKQYCVGDVDCKQADGVNFDNYLDNGTFFMCYSEDCFDPPVAIVRADDVEEAIDLFVDECEWARMSDEDVEERDKDGLGETVGWTGMNKYDNETMQCRSIKLYRVEC